MDRAIKLLEEARDRIDAALNAMQFGAPVNWLELARTSARIDALLKTGGWTHVIEPPNPVAWVDNQARYVGIFRDGKRYVLPLPPLPDEKD